MPAATLERSPGERRGAARFLLAAPADMLFILFLAALPLARGWQAINTDGDLGRHLRVGREILADGLFFTDRFSWTMQGQPFVPYEWLSEILFTLSHRWAGFWGVLVLCGLLVGATAWLLTVWFRRMGVDPLLGFLATAAASLAGSFHWLARPHLWSLLGTVAVLFLWTDGQKDGGTDTDQPAPIRPSGYPAIRRLTVAALLFAVWANLHGGFLFGLVLLALIAVGEALDGWWRPRDGRTSVLLVPSPAALRTIALLGAAVVGSCINPVGPALFAHMARTLGNSWVLAMTMEYRSPNFHLWWGKVFLVLLSACIAAAALSRRRVPFRVLVPFLVTTAFALHSARNIPLWALSGFPLLVWHLDGDWRSLQSGLLHRLRSSFELAARSARPGLWSAVAAIVAVGWARAAPPHPGFDPNVFPVEAVARARAEGVQGRIFNELAWGGYILCAWPEQQVFIDAQTDFYGEALSQEYMSIRNADPGWEEKLNRRGVTLVLVPEEAPLARVLEAMQPHDDANRAGEPRLRQMPLEQRTLLLPGR